MNLDQQKQSFAAMMAKMKVTLFSKGNDYANTDRLSNFKLAGSIAGGSAETNCLNLIATKVARLGVLLNSTGTPNNESIEDSILDLANYAVLLNMIREDNGFDIDSLHDGYIVNIIKSDVPAWDADGIDHNPKA